MNVGRPNLLTAWMPKYVASWNIGVRPVYGKGSHPLLQAGSRTARAKITMSVIPNRLTYCLIFLLCT